MWPFKKHKSIEELDSDNHAWSVLEVTRDGEPMIVRLNESAKEWVRHPNLSIRVGFAIPLKNPNPNGMPDTTESEVFAEIEDGIASLISETGPSIQALVVTTGTFKEFVFYIQNGSSIANVHKQASLKFPDYEVQCYGENDPKWLGYLQWQKA